MGSILIEIGSILIEMGSIDTKRTTIQINVSHGKKSRNFMRIYKCSQLPRLLQNSEMVNQVKKTILRAGVLFLFLSGIGAWTGEINGKVICDVCGDSAIGPVDHAMEGAEVAILCMTKSGEIVNYQAFTNSKGMYSVAETMPESNRWDGCLARPISSFHEHCTRLGGSNSGIKFSYNHPSGFSHTLRPFLYKPINSPLYCV